MKKVLIIFICITNLSGVCLAEESVETDLSLDIMGAYYPGNQEGYQLEGNFELPSYSVIDLEPSVPLMDPGRTIGSSWGGAEAKAALSYSLKFPFLQADGALFSDNNLTMKFSGELSPVSINSLVEATLTPIALLNFKLGVKGGSGWTIGFNGLGLNLPGPENTAAQEEPFSGLVYELFGSGTFQFDVGAVVPGDWTHIVMVAEGKIMYKGFTGADADQAWVWEADDGMNYNGLLYKGTYFLGYQIPLVLDTAGFLVETSQYIDAHNVERSQSSPADWNSAFINVRLGLVFNFALTEKMSLAILPQFCYDRKYTDTTMGNRYFEYREFEKGYLYFERLAFSYTMHF